MVKSAVPATVLKKLAAGPAKVAKLWQSASAKQRSFREAPDRWTLREVVCHLLDVEITLGWRLRHIVGDDDPRIVPFDQDKWVARLAFQDLDPKLCLKAYAALRACTVEIARRLTAEQLAREALHPEYGTISARWVIERFVHHDATHVDQMMRTAKAFGRLARKKN